MNYDTIVNTLNHMIETGDNFAKTYIQLYFDDIRERFNLAFIEIKAYIKTRNIRTKKVNRVITSEEFIRTTY